MLNNLEQYAITDYMKRLPTDELRVLISDMYEKDELTFAEIAAKLKKQGVTGPNAAGYLTPIAVNKIYHRSKAKAAVETHVESESLKEQIRRLIKLKINEKDFYKIVGDLVK